MWNLLKSNRSYIGSAFNLSQRLSNYLNVNYLNVNYLKNNKMYIYKALLHHGYPSFSLSILEYIDITDMTKVNARKLILSREQHFIDTFKPEYNILPTAGSSLRTIRSIETITKISGENNHFYGKTHTIASKSLINKGLTGKIKSVETKAKIRKALKGRTLYVNTPKRLCKKVFVYDKDNKITIFKEFNSYTEAGKFFNYNVTTTSRNIDKNKIFQNKWVLSRTLIISSKVNSDSEE